MSEKKITYVEAIGQAIHEEMLRDEAVLLIGEDVDEHGGVFKSNALEAFGAGRVINISMPEATLIGSMVGAALMGLRPIASITHRDFLASGFEQVMNMASQMYWRVGMPIPIVVRSFSSRVGGEVLDAGSQEGWPLQMTGIKVVVPSTTYDAKGMLKAAVRDDNPVLYLERRLLYRLPELREELPTEDYTVPLGKAIVRREGEDMSILTYGSMVHQCLKAARVLEEDDKLEVEVLDLRSLSPLDREAIMASVKRTNKVLIVHEDALTAWIGSELAAIVSEDLLEYLDGPVTQIGASGLSLPYVSPVDAAYQPPTEKILSAARALAAY